jgi:hypothetical protein
MAGQEARRDALLHSAVRKAALRFVPLLTIALIGFSVALIGASAAPAIWTVPTRLLTGVAAAGGLAFINSIATVGGFVGPTMMGWLPEFSGSYVFGLAAVAAIMIVSTIASMSLKLVVSHE